MANGNVVVCALCGGTAEADTLKEVHWQAAGVLERLARTNPRWRRTDGACPACVQRALLDVLLEGGEEALHEAVQKVWPLDAEAAFGALPTPLRMHADPRFAGRGVTLAMVDAGFFPHPDLIRPLNRIKAWADAGRAPVLDLRFDAEETPQWPGWDQRVPSQWHGLMTSTVAAGNGFQSHGLYRGLASEAELVLVQVREPEQPGSTGGGITNESLTRALLWLLEHAKELNLRVVSISVGGESIEAPGSKKAGLAGNLVDAAIAALVAHGIPVIVAAGNSGERRLVPPATAPAALTIGGLDDKNTFSHDEHAVWHSNYGEVSGANAQRVPKPELVAPSIWVAAPVLPGSEVEREALLLFEKRVNGQLDGEKEARIAGLKLITPHYQHVDGTSFAAPLVASTVCCLLEANPQLTPKQVREILIAAAHPVAGAEPERQGAGALDAGQAVALALEAREGNLTRHPETPQVTPQRILFHLHDRAAQRVEVLGSWNDWRGPGIEAWQTQPGIWRAERAPLPPGRYAYKFLLDGQRWMEDPANPKRLYDGKGGFNSVLEVNENEQLRK